VVWGVDCVSKVDGGGHIVCKCSGIGYHVVFGAVRPDSCRHRLLEFERTTVWCRASRRPIRTSDQRHHIESWPLNSHTACRVLHLQRLCSSAAAVAMLRRTWLSSLGGAAAPVARSAKPHGIASGAQRSAVARTSRLGSPGSNGPTIASAA
jgi:hypothetical protein